MSKGEYSFSNYGYQLNDIKGNEDTNYTIPKARIDRNSLSHRVHPGPDTIDAPDYNDSEANFPHAVKRRSSRPLSESKPPQEQEEDYSLLSFIPAYRNRKRNHDPQQKKGKGSGILKKIILSIFVLLYISYFIGVLMVPSTYQQKDGVKYWCDADGFLIIITSLVFTLLFYFNIFKPFVIIPIYNFTKKRDFILFQILKKIINHWLFSAFVVLGLIGALVAFLVIDTAEDRTRLVSALGIVILLLFGFVFSAAPRKVIWRHVLWGIGLQFVFGLLILRWPVGRETFQCLGSKVDRFLKFTDDGSSFVFGDKLIKEFHVFAFSVLSVVLFFSFCIQILYYFGAMQWIVIKLGWLLQVSVGTTACESVNAAANIFLGQTEAPLLIKPYLPVMTKSELHAVMTGGFATIAGSVLAAYISFGVSPSHLLSASVMSAPAALGFAKLFYPEVEKSITTSDNIQIVKGTEANVLHAACEGVTTAIPLVANIAANLIAFVAFMAFVDTVLNWSCVLLNVEDGVCSLSTLFGYTFMPLAWIMGVPWHDCYNVGQLIGTKTFVNEFVGYLKLQELVKKGALDARSETIATYALCGFSNVSSIGIQIGGLGAMAPERKRDLAIVAVRAMIAGSIACFLTACVAGTLLTEEELMSDAVAANSTALM